MATQTINIGKSLNELNISINWNENDEKIAENILECLKACKVVVVALSQLDPNLLMAEGILKFLFNSLSKNRQI